MRTLITCPGIGDFLWVAQKLQGREQFKVVMSDSLPRRGHQLMELLPDLISAHEYRPGLTYKKVNDNNIIRRKGRREWCGITEQEFYLSANEHLEQGRRIEELLPDLPTSFTLNYSTSDEDKRTASALLPSGPYIGIYTSAYSNARNWNGWGPKEWFEMVELLQPTGATIVIIGAAYDVGVVEELTKAMDQKKIKYINTTGQPLGVVVEILKRLNYFLGFPSGLSILNETLGKDGVMFYPPHLQKMMNTWAHPDRISSGAYKGCLFPEPEELLKWLKKEYKIFDRT